MTLYESQPRLYTLIGRTADRPTVPPDKHCLFWDIELSQLWAVNDSMAWVLINAPFPTSKGVNTHRANFSFAADPSALLFTTLNDNTFIIRVYVDVQTAFDPGATAIIGDAGDTDRLVKNDQINLQEVGLYEVSPLFNYPVPTNIEVRVNGGSVNGFAVVYFVYDYDSQN